MLQLYRIVGPRTWLKVCSEISLETAIAAGERHFSRIPRDAFGIRIWPIWALVLAGTHARSMCSVSNHRFEVVNKPTACFSIGSVHFC